jgi:2-oxoglutarate dehydrogenase E1 component
VFLAGSSANYLEEMYQAWTKDPSSVHVSWQAYFKNVSNGASPGTAFALPPNLLPPGNGAGVALAPFDTSAGPATGSEITDHLKVQLLARAYQVRGHHLAKLDPLGIHDADLDPSTPPELDIEFYGFKTSDLDRTFSLGPGMLPGYRSTSPKLTLREIIQSLKETYCGSIGLELAHIPDRGQCDWLRERAEIPHRLGSIKKEDKQRILDRLIWSDLFERFVAQKYPSEKRFGLEGCEALIPGMKALVRFVLI